MHISAQYRALQEELHASNEFYGTSGQLYAELVAAVSTQLQTKAILDYGCGKRTLETALGFDIHNYDPGIRGLDATPLPDDIVVCTDVLEHIEPEHLDGVLDDLKLLTKRVVVLSIATVPAKKYMSDGRNAHLIVQPFEWWLPKLQAKFRTLRYWDLPERKGFIFIGQSFKDRNPTPNFNVIGPKPTLTKIQTKSVYTDEQRCENIRSAMLRGLPIIQVLPKHDRTMVLACYGPSLADTFDQLKEDAKRPDHDVFTVSGAHDFLIDRGLVPMAHIESDPRPHKAKLWTSNRGVAYFAASACDRAVFNKLHGFETWIWHVTSSNKETELIAKMDLPGSFTVDGGTNVGMCGIAVGTVLGYRKFIIHAMDCSFKASEELLHWPKDKAMPADVRKKAGFHAGPHPNEDQDVYRVWVDKQPFLSSPQMFQGAQDYLAMVSVSWNCSFELRGDGFLPALVMHAKKLNRAKRAKGNAGTSRAA